MMLLHISDIHFRYPDCEDPTSDPEQTYRTRLVQDARTRSDTLEPVGAILVTGDIAYHGHPQEYEVAFNWLMELAGVCGCSLERVFVVPGNHDVDRGIIINSPETKNVQQAISLTPFNRRERELRTQFSNEQTGRALLAPLAAYNDFASRFSCQIYPPKHLFWQQDLPLEQGVKLRIHGLTSTLLSGIGGLDDVPGGGNLYLSPLQTVLDPVDDVVNLVMSHHPPDWLVDNDDVNDAVCTRSAIHLFGHKHRQRVTRDPDYFRFSAGAVNPERNDPGWKPGYNLISLQVNGEGLDRVLKFDAHILEWSDTGYFQPKKTRLGEDIYLHSIAIPGRTPESIAVSSVATNTTVETLGEAYNEVDAYNEVEAAMGDKKTRNLVSRFWDLTISQRREITYRLKLIDNDELQLLEPERYGRALLRAGERNLLDELAHEITQVEE